LLDDIISREQTALQQRCEKQINMSSCVFLVIMFQCLFYINPDLKYSEVPKLFKNVRPGYWFSTSSVIDY